MKRIIFGSLSLLLMSGALAPAAMAQATAQNSVAIRTPLINESNRTDEQEIDSTGERKLENIGDRELENNNETTDAKSRVCTFFDLVTPVL